MSYLTALSEKQGFSLDEPYGKLDKKIRHIIMFGDSEKLDIKYQSDRFNISASSNYEGVIPNLKRRYFDTQSPEMREWLEKYMKSAACPLCHGDRLKKESLAVKVEGMNIMEITRCNVDDIYLFLKKLSGNLNEKRKIIAERILKEINARLKFIIDVGLNYITLDRKVSTISGGEFQRIRLATQIGFRPGRGFVRPGRTDNRASQQRY